MKIGIINYGVGNIFSLKNALFSLKVEAGIIQYPREIKKYDKIILPGVGAFAHCMKELEKSNLKNELLRCVHDGKYLLGICVGMQMLFDSSVESEYFEGLALIKGTVKKINTKNKIPHIGWNVVSLKKENFLLKTPDWFYFVHSYCCVPQDETQTIGTTQYGADIVSIVHHKNLYGCQFHPEKSHLAGINFLKKFCLSL